VIAESACGGINVEIDSTSGWGAEAWNYILLKFWGINISGSYCSDIIV